jgi:hypothetical protein
MTFGEREGNCCMKDLEMGVGKNIEDVFLRRP